MRIMGLDYGSKTVGVAISDPLGITAQAIETICRKDENKLRKTCARIETLIEEYKVERIVDSEEDDAECLILKDTSEENAPESVYEIVDDDVELTAIAKVFEELLEDVDIER